jgi:ribosomal protein S18 acetylase RimI-like enzyme
MKISIREATCSDVQGIAHVHVAAWKTAYRGIVPQPFLDSLDVASRVETWKGEFDKGGSHICVAENETEVCGFASGGALREPIEDFDAEIYAIYLLPTVKGRGAGRLLMQHLAQTLRNDGFSRVAVWVLGENPSRSFYEHLGAKLITQKLIRIGDADLPEVAYGWHDIRTLATPAEDRS